METRTPELWLQHRFSTELNASDEGGKEVEKIRKGGSGEEALTGLGNNKGTSKQED